MPEKRNIYRSYGEKLISLFARLLFSGQSYSLTELARMLHCSKQTVLRLLDDIRMAYGVDIDERYEGRRKYVRITRPGKVPPGMALTSMELDVLYMCRAFAEHLLGRSQFEHATRALLKGHTLASNKERTEPHFFGTFRPGTIDYTPHQETIRTLIEAMEQSRICRVTYQAMWDGRAKQYRIQPLKLFSHGDTIYLHARMATGTNSEPPEFDPLLVVHRVRKAEMTDDVFVFPKDYDFEKVFNREFGIIKEEPFEVQAEFTGWAARYVAERIWSPDQTINKKRGGRIILTFTASSEYEVLSWVLSFRDEARLLKPGWLVETIETRISQLQRAYSPPKRLTDTL
jgi:predicted DNA-binding transcriptional regulator YafY